MDTFQKGGNYYGKEDESERIFEGIGGYGCYLVYDPDYRFSSGSKVDSAFKTSSWQWELFNAVVMEEEFVT
jgi:hypothetical protein